MMDIQQAFLQLQNDFEKLIVSKERGIKKNYSKAYKDLRNKLQKVYDDYEKDKVVDVDEFKKYNRLKKLDAETAALLVKLYIDNKKLIKSTLNEVISTTEKSSFKIFKDTGINPIKRKFDSTKVINQEIAGKIWTDRMKHYGDNFVYDVHSVIRQGLERGDTYTTMSKTLKEKFGKDLKRSTTIARTESARVQSYAKNATMEEVNKQTPLTKTWRTMKDEGVRSSHQAMEGVTVKFDEEFTLPSGATCMYPTSSGNPAEDINCRCYLEYKLDTETEIKSEEVTDLGYNKNEIYLSKSFDDLRQVLGNKEIEIEEAVRELNFEMVKNTIGAIVDVSSEYPDALNNIKLITTSNKGVMSCSGGKITFNPQYYKDIEKLKKACLDSSKSGWWIKNASIESIGVHEFGHAINWDLISKNPNYTYDFERIFDWNSDSTAKQIVSQACKDIKKTPYGKGLTNKSIRSAQSNYGATNAGEAIAEAFADKYINKKNANPLSLRIIELIDERFIKYKGAK